MSRPLLPGDSLLRLGDAIDRHDLPAAMNVLAQAGGQVIAPATDEETDEDAGARPRKRRKRPAQLDPSGYPTIASLAEADLRALVQAAWARCHGNAVRQTGYVSAFRRLLKRQLVEIAPKSLSGDHVTWYAATSLGALVVLKALLNGNRRIVRAAAELR